MQKSRKDYLRHPESVDDNDMCFFCMDLCVDPIQCQGPCKSVSCRRCASEWCQNGRRLACCPKKCSEPWHFQLLPRKKFEMQCPYNPSCTIEYPEQLERHLQICPFSPQEVQQRNHLRNNYMCQNNHELKFFIASFEEIVNSKCQECQEKGDCRSKCPTCLKTYCVKCRAPPCSRECCPLGHSYQFVKPARRTTICDMCGMSAGLVGLGVHSDRSCNFDVCELCYEKLPSNNSENEIVKRVRNIVGNICTKHHELTVMETPQMGMCKLCSKDKVCWKECKTCTEVFCLACKQPSVSRVLKCEHDHDYERKEASGPCMMCGVTGHSHMLADAGCKIQLCVQCTKRLLSIESEKRRMKKYHSCDKNHVLGFLGYRTIQKCQQCNEQRSTVFYCMECKPLKCYCLRCKPMDCRDSCMFGDPLTKIARQQDIEFRCLLCQATDQPEMWVCKFCEFEICQACRNA